MKKTTHSSGCKYAYFRNFLTFAILMPLIFGLLSCAKNEIDNSHIGTQRHLIAELERNQLLWSQSGVTDYSFSLDKECVDCPSELKSQESITVKVGQGGEFPAVRSKAGARAISARDDDDDDERRFSQGVQAVSVDSLFTDLRLAILQNSVQQVSFNPVYGYPQTVLVNNAAIPVNNFGQTINVDYDDDDYRPNPNLNLNPNLSIQTSGFQVLGTNNNLPTITLNGQFIRQTNSFSNIGTQYWLIDNNGQWNQLNILPNVYPALNTIQDQSYVQVSGLWLPGGVNGQGQINVQQIIPNQTVQTQNNLAGTLFYSVLNNTSYDLDDFYVTNDVGSNIFLNLPANFQNQAFQLAGQRVNLTGSWTPYANAPNARFIPNALNTANTVLEQFTGILSQSSAYPIPGVQQTNYILIDDFGGVMELQIPANVVNNINMSIGQRVTVSGTRINAGIYGQSVVYVQSVSQQQNIFTNTLISGVITAVLPADIYGTMERVLLQLDTGSTVTLNIPAIYRDPYNAFFTGVRIQANGAWISNGAFGQAEFEARAPVQITNMGVTSSSTYSGYISNVGSNSNGLNCNATPSSYTFISDTGQQFQLYVSGTTLITGLNNQNTSLPYQARIQVSATQVTPGVLQAQTITVTPQYETTITGTIIEIGAAGNTFGCTGALNTYRLLDTYGNAYSITTSATTLVQGSQGSFLRIGDVVSASGTMSNNGTTFYASTVIASFPANVGTPFPVTPAPFPVGQIPGNNNTSLVGTVTGLSCSNNFSNTYNFVDQSGMLYSVNINQSLQTGLFIDVGTQLQVTGSLINNEIMAQQVVQIQTFADPINRIPVSGSIISMTASVPSLCNTSVYTYQFQNDNGQIQQLRLTTEAALHLPQPITNGTRITILSRVQSINSQLIDALEIQYQNTGGQTFGVGNGFGNTGQTISVVGTIVATACTNEYYFVDQNGSSYQLQLNAALLNIGVGIGTRLNVSGQVVGSQLVASTAYNDTSAIYSPIQAPVNGSISSLINTETLSCGITVNTYTFQNDNGITQRLRVASSNAGFTVPGQTLVIGSRVSITNKIESFDGQVIDALSMSQQNFF